MLAVKSSDEIERESNYRERPDRKKWKAARVVGAMRELLARVGAGEIEMEQSWTKKGPNCNTYSPQASRGSGSSRELLSPWRRFCAGSRVGALVVGSGGIQTEIIVGPLTLREYESLGNGVLAGKIREPGPGLSLVPWHNGVMVSPMTA